MIFAIHIGSIFMKMPKIMVNRSSAQFHLIVLNVIYTVEQTGSDHYFNDLRGINREMVSNLFITKTMTMSCKHLSVTLSCNIGIRHTLVLNDNIFDIHIRKYFQLFLYHHLVIFMTITH